MDGRAPSLPSWFAGRSTRLSAASLQSLEDGVAEQDGVAYYSLRMPRSGKAPLGSCTGMMTTGIARGLCPCASNVIAEVQADGDSHPRNGAGLWDAGASRGRIVRFSSPFKV